MKKIQPATFGLAFLLTFATVTTMTLFTGCVAGDKYSRSTGQYVDDKGIDSRVRDALNDNAEYKFEGVKVVSFKSRVQLSGFVDTGAQKDTAGDITKKVQGVRDVDNAITVKDDSGRSTGEYIDDKSLTSRVNAGLRDNAEYKFEEVGVASYKGTVQLSGFVNTADQKDKAGDIAKQTPGTQNLINNISVKDKL
ncbi:MAG TPA: BON domain-containing protein [Verrucomicrobiae bacterium]|nr:BON domain-containing protein [Verrucomicrobiae bacterium]